MAGSFDAQFLVFIGTLPALAVQAFGGAELSKIHRTLTKFADQDLTLADAHGLVIMSERRSAICWSTDRHLGLTGVKLATT
jgi:hypothetical protein